MMTTICYACYCTSICKQERLTLLIEKHGLELLITTPTDKFVNFIQRKQATRKLNVLLVNNILVKSLIKSDNVYKTHVKMMGICIFSLHCCTLYFRKDCFTCTLFKLCLTQVLFNKCRNYLELWIDLVSTYLIFNLY
jgi:hypothetical protein